MSVIGRDTKDGEVESERDGERERKKGGRESIFEGVRHSDNAPTTCFSFSNEQRKTTTN